MIANIGLFCFCFFNLCNTIFEQYGPKNYELEFLLALYYLLRPQQFYLVNMKRVGEAKMALLILILFFILRPYPAHLKLNAYFE